MVRIVGKVPDSFLSKKVLFLSDLGQSTLVVEDQLLGKRGGSVWDGRGGVEEGVWGVRGEWRRECVWWERRRVDEGVCGWEGGERRREMWVGSEGGSVWERRVEKKVCEWERWRVEEGVCGWERKRVEEELCGRGEEKSGGGRCG